MAALKQTNDAYSADGSTVSDATYDDAARQSLRMCGPENGINDGGAEWKSQAEQVGYAAASPDKVFSALCKQSDPGHTTALCKSQ